MTPWPQQGAQRLTATAQGCCWLLLAAAGEKVLSCMADGGIAAIIYGHVDQSSCEQIDAWPSLYGACSDPEQG